MCLFIQFYLSAGPDFCKKCVDLKITQCKWKKGQTTEHKYIMNGDGRAQK